MKLVKSSYDKKLFGVCGGIANLLKLDSTLVRILFVIGTLISFGTSVILYIAMALILPSDD